MSHQVWFCPKRGDCSLKISRIFAGLNREPDDKTVDSKRGSVLKDFSRQAGNSITCNIITQCSKNCQTTPKTSKTKISSEGPPFCQEVPSWSKPLCSAASYVPSPNFLDFFSACYIPISTLRATFPGMWWGDDDMMGIYNQHESTYHHIPWFGNI